LQTCEDRAIWILEVASNLLTVMDFLVEAFHLVVVVGFG
jgi:hypothetical protein